MRKVTQNQVVRALHEVGVQVGDGLLVHSALQLLGLPEMGIGIYLDAMFEVLGTKGTVVVPTFNFTFTGGEDYDPQRAPSVGMGVFSEYIRQHPEALRTTHPMQSYAAIGKYAVELAACDTPSAFDDGSAVDRMLNLGFKLLLLGADIQAVSTLHYSEQRAGVPYRYWKDFSGRILRDGEWQEATYRMFARDMEIDARLEIYKIQNILESKGGWSSVKFNYGVISLCSLVEFISITDMLLAQDPWVFVTNLPEELK